MIPFGGDRTGDDRGCCQTAANLSVSPTRVPSNARAIGVTSDAEAAMYTCASSKNTRDAVARKARRADTTVERAQRFRTSSVLCVWKHKMSRETVRGKDAEIEKESKTMPRLCSRRCLQSCTYTVLVCLLSCRLFSVADIAFSSRLPSGSREL